jgi:hypothetical protein
MASLSAVWAENRPARDGPSWNPCHWTLEIADPSTSVTLSGQMTVYRQVLRRVLSGPLKGSGLAALKGKPVGPLCRQEIFDSSHRILADPPLDGLLAACTPPWIVYSACMAPDSQAGRLIDVHSLDRIADLLKTTNCDTTTRSIRVGRDHVIIATT